MWVYLVHESRSQVYTLTHHSLIFNYKVMINDITISYEGLVSNLGPIPNNMIWTIISKPAQESISIMTHTEKESNRPAHEWFCVIFVFVFLLLLIISCVCVHTLTDLSAELDNKRIPWHASPVTSSVCFCITASCFSGRSDHDY